MKKILTRLAGLFALTSALLVPQLSAIALDTTSASYVGSITPGGGSPETEAEYINYLISLAAPTPATTVDGQTYVRSSNLLPGLPEADPSSKSDNDETEHSLTNFTGYVLGKYDAGNAGSWVWYLSGFTGDIQLPATYSSGHELSHTTFFGTTSVPDGGTTALLLGLGLVAVSLAHRRRRTA